MSQYRRTRRIRRVYLSTRIKTEAQRDWRCFPFVLVQIRQYLSDVFNRAQLLLYLCRRSSTLTGGLSDFGQSFATRIRISDQCPVVDEGHDHSKKEDADQKRGKTQKDITSPLDTTLTCLSRGGNIAVRKKHVLKQIVRKKLCAVQTFGILIAGRRTASEVEPPKQRTFAERVRSKDCRRKPAQLTAQTTKPSGKLKYAQLLF